MIIHLFHLSVQTKTLGRGLLGLRPVPTATQSSLMKGMNWGSFRTDQGEGLCSYLFLFPPLAAGLSVVSQQQQRVMYTLNKSKIYFVQSAALGGGKVIVKDENVWA